MAKVIEQGEILGMGNPLLDILTVVENEDLLKKYGLSMNNAILADETMGKKLFEEIVKDFKVEYIAGGATQNSIRVAQWMLQSAPGATSFVGCVGQDDFATKLEEEGAKDGVEVRYLKNPEVATGACAVIVYKNERSLVARLGAANTYKQSHLMVPENHKLLEQAKCVYISGFFLTVSPETIMHVAQHCADNKKTMMMNLSAPFVCEFFNEPLLEALSLVDIVFGNESECAAFGAKMGYTEKTVHGIAKEMAKIPLKKGNGERIVIITQGTDPCVVVQGTTVTEYPVIKAEKLVDTNGAGDAFVGGFLSQFVQHKHISECVRAGMYASSYIVQVSGCQFTKGPPEFK